MKEDLLVLYLYIKQAGFEEVFKSFERDLNSRKFIQKYIYILQDKFNVSFGYQYSLYLYGPYSPELTESIYEIKNEENVFTDLSNKYKLNKSAIEDISSFEKIFPDLSLKDVDWFEVLSTYYYLYTKTYRYESNQKIKCEKCEEYIKVNKTNLSDHINNSRKFLLKYLIN